ncbi:MAG: response regulator, partial [bacterium]|nr:response regulator [bacterium]
RMPAERCVGPATAAATATATATTQTQWLGAREPAAAPAGDENDATPEVQRGRILLVEDHEDLRGYITRLLAEAGWLVTDVGDAESAQPLLIDHDLLLSDVMLPGIDGLDLARWVRRDEALRWTPVILLTARADRESIIAGLHAGADDFISKPFDPEELIARVGTHLELSLLRKVVLDEADNRAANLQRALGSNRVIGTALGILMANERISADEAFVRLREASQTSNRKLRDVADDVVFTGALSV